MNKKDLKKIIDDDEFGILEIKVKSSADDQTEDRLIASFQEINTFFRKNEREPRPNSDDISEFKLYSRLEMLRKDRRKAKKLIPFDEFHLLKNIKTIESLGDIFSDDDLGILNDGPDSIFKIKNIPKATVEIPDEIARRTPCKDFGKFKNKFITCQSDITIGKRKLLPFAREQQISEGNFFILKGILVYVAKVGKKKNVKGKTNARLRCIFENGTESNMLLRSLARELYKDGRRVTEHEEKLLSEFSGITDEDENTGFIYVLRSLSEKSEIKSISHLFKVGFSTIPVEQRIKNASDDPTFLMAPVAIVSSYQCYNLNPQKLELLLHRFFGSSCLDIDVVDQNGKRYRPREWFVAPLEVIEQAIHYILTGQIIDFRYDPEKKEIVGR